MEIDLRGKIDKISSQVTQETKSRAFNAAKELRNAAHFVLEGARSGKVYRKPGTKYVTYQASAPGEPPANRSRSGGLRTSWTARAESEKGTKRIAIHSVIWTDKHYAPLLQDGTSRMAARPFKEEIVERARPKITAIFNEPFLN